jgi:arylformamidase
VSTTFVELSHSIENGMPSYPGIPGPYISALLDHQASRARYDNQAEFYLGKVELAGNTGTYLDSPFHRDASGDDLSQVPLEAVAGVPAVVVDCAMNEDRAVDVDAAPGEIAGRAVLVRTRWDTRWGSEEYWSSGPFLSASTVELLADARPALVGVDFSNVDDTNDPARPAHTRLLRANVLVLEHLCNLDPLPPTGARIYAVPLRIKGSASFPVRAFAELSD